MKNDVLAKNIRSYRRLSGMTQNDLAAKLYIAPQTVSKWESGISEPDAEKLCVLADIFGISLDQLMRVQGSNNQRAFIAIDGGGTKTDFVLFTESGEILERFTLGGSNPNAHSIAHSKEILVEGIDRLCRSGAQVAGIFAGISGASAGNNRGELNSFLKKRYPYIKSRVEGDIYNVINSVEGTENGCIAVICGTGSVVYGYDGSELYRRGGWGYLFDEAGSGFDIGRDALRHALAAEEGECEQSALAIAVRETVGGGIFENISSIYARGKDHIASFAPIVLEYASRGECVALEIVQKTVDRLAHLINGMSASYDCGDLVVIAGGLISRRDILEPMLRERINNGLRLVFADCPQIVGAAVKCARLYADNFDISVFTAEFLSNFHKIQKI